MTRAETEASVRACYATYSENYYHEYYGSGAPYPPVQRDLGRLQQSAVPRPRPVPAIVTP